MVHDEKEAFWLVPWAVSKFVIWLLRWTAHELISPNSFYGTLNTVEALWVDTRNQTALLTAALTKPCLSSNSYKVCTVEPPLMDTSHRQTPLVSGHLVMFPATYKHYIFLTSHKRTPLLSVHFFWSRGCPLTGGSTVFTHSRKWPAPVADTFSASHGCPLWLYFPNTHLTLVQ